MDFFQMINRLKNIRTPKILVPADNQKHNDAAKQPTPLDYQELSIRIGLLHAYCNTSFSFDTARCNLLFYDWYSQKFKKNELENILINCKTEVKNDYQYRRTN